MAIIGIITAVLVSLGAWLGLAAGDTMKISAVFSKACDLAIAQGFSGLNKIPGCLEIYVDERWWFAINAHPETVESTKGNVPPMTIYFEFNGWPAGMIGPRDGCLCGGAAANEGELIKALDAAIAKAEVTR